MRCLGICFSKGHTNQWDKRIQKLIVSVCSEENTAVVSELTSAFTFMFYDLLSWAPIDKTLEAHLLYLGHFNRMLNKALAPWSELLHNILMDLKTVVYSDCKDLCAWGKKDLMDVIYSKHVRLIPLFIDGNNLLIIEYSSIPIIYTFSTTLFIFILWWLISTICTFLLIMFYNDIFLGLWWICLQLWNLLPNINSEV